MPFELAEPVWIEDDDIDLDYHVRSVTLRRPGTMQQLDSLIARLHSTLLDRSRPLWEMYVIEGLENGQVAFYSKAHHSGVDGKAGVELAKVLYDVSPKIREVPPPRRKRGGGSYQLGITELLQAAAANSASQYRKLAGVLPGAAKALTAAASVVASQRTTGGARSLNLGLAPKTIFNVSITNQRSYSTLSVPLADIKELGKRVGGTVNTIVMALCSIALHRFLKERDSAAERTAHRFGAGQPARRRRQRDEQSGVDGPGRSGDRHHGIAVAPEGDPRLVRGGEGGGEGAEAGARVRTPDHGIALAYDRARLAAWPLQFREPRTGGRQRRHLECARAADDALHGRRADGALLPGLNPVSRQRAEYHGAELRRVAGVRPHRLSACGVTGRILRDRGALAGRPARDRGAADRSMRTPASSLKRSGLQRRRLSNRTQ